MFITFHKQVSVIKTYRPPSTLLLTPLPFPSPSRYSPDRPYFLFFRFIFSKFLFLSTESCDILCIFKRLIRVLLCFYSRDYEYRCCRCCCCSRCCYLRKSFYQKRQFFVTRNLWKSTQYVRHMMHLFCHVCPIITRERKRRSWANFRSRYINEKTHSSCLRFRFGACKWHTYIENRPYVTLNASMSRKKMHTILTPVEIHGYYPEDQRLEIHFIHRIIKKRLNKHSWTNVKSLKMN